VEIVQCELPGWQTSLAHATAANGLHGRLVVGTPRAVDEVPDLAGSLPSVRLQLCKDGTTVDEGEGANVLDSPLLALSHLVTLLARQPEAPPLAAGEIISTGTLTDAHPVAPGERWSTRLSGMPLDGLAVRFT
jgi:2-oxo-3-hexenedioate decarboxylase